MRLLAPLFTLVLSLPALAQAPCLEWSDEFGVPGVVNGAITAAEIFDDGSGDALYFGGGFSWAAGVEIDNLARWDGATMTPVADFGSDPNSWITHMQVCDTGSGPELYVMGKTISTVDGISVNKIARWDGATWADVGGGLPDVNSFYSAAAFDDGSGEALYIGITAAPPGSPTGTSELRKWDGSSWTSLSSGGPVARAMAVYDDGTGAALYASGNGAELGRWDGASWSVVGGDVTGTVDALVVYDDGSGPELYVGGNISAFGALAFDYLASWDGSAWTAVPGGDLFRVESLGVHDLGRGPQLFAGRAGPFAAWDGMSWATLGAGMLGSVEVQASFDAGSGAKLFVGTPGFALTPTIAFGVGVWDGAAWAELGTLGGGLNDRVHALGTFDDGSGPALIAGGEFFASGSQSLVEFVGRWDGTEWSPLGTVPGLFGGAVRALIEFDDGTGPALYAAADANVTTLGGLAKWDGTLWTEPGALTVNGRALEVFDDGSGDALYLGGVFDSTISGAANNIARWDGTAFSALGLGLDAEVESLAVHDDGTGDALFAGGVFTTAGGAPASGVAKWDGAAWSALGSGIVGSVDALHSFGGRLYAGGVFSTAGGVAADGIAMWDGASWSALPMGALGSSAEVFALEVFDDGTGDALWVTGVFAMAGGVAAESVAKWDGVQWSLPPGGLGLGSVQLGVPAPGGFALQAHNDGNGAGDSLFIGGALEKAGSNQANNIVALRRMCDCAPVTYCTAGTTASGCQALLSAVGTASASASSGFTLTATGVEGLKDGLYFFGTQGRQANTWGSGTSFQCVKPPVKRAGLLIGVGTVGLCDGVFNQDLNALWCPTCPRPSKNPSAGAIVQAQLWFRDPFNTSNQTTSLSDAIEFSVCP